MSFVTIYFMIIRHVDKIIVFKISEICCYISWGRIWVNRMPETYLVLLVLAVVIGDSEAITVLGTDDDTEDGS